MPAGSLFKGYRMYYFDDVISNHVKFVCTRTKAGLHFIAKLFALDCSLLKEKQSTRIGVNYESHELIRIVAELENTD